MKKDFIKKRKKLCYKLLAGWAALSYIALAIINIFGNRGQIYAWVIVLGALAVASPVLIGLFATVDRIFKTRGITRKISTWLIFPQACFFSLIVCTFGDISYFMTIGWIPLVIICYTSSFVGLVVALSSLWPEYRSNWRIGVPVAIAWALEALFINGTLLWLTTFAE